MTPTRAALLALLLLAPLAAADHVYSHRVVVTGRVVDAEGRPAPALPVTVRFAGLQAEARCFDAGDERTGPQGDFALCRHAHAVPDDVLVNVTAGNASAEARLEPALRRVAFLLRLPDAAPARDLEGERLFARTFRVEGRVMRLAGEPTQVEGVDVAALPEGGGAVVVTLTGPAGLLAAANATTDEHGDYAADLDAPDVPEGARVRVTVRDGEREQPASAEFRRADVDVVLPAALRLADVDRPGTSTPKVPLPGALVLLALGTAALIAGTRRRP